MLDDADSDPFGVLDRVTSILEAFDQDDHGLGISELAVRADLPKSTVSRLVATLVRERYLERDGRRIHLGLRLFELGQLAERPRALRTAASPVMADLRNRTGHSVHLAIRDGHEMVCIAGMRGRFAAPIAIRIGTRVPLHATALGKIELAHAAAADLDAVIAAALTPWTPHTIVDPVQLRRELACVRRAGFAAEVREFSATSSAVASPVFTASGTLVAALAVSGDAEVFDPRVSAASVHEAALALTRRVALDAEH